MDGNLVVIGTSWTLTIPAGDALAEDTYSVTATATDDAGNTGTDITTNELVIDTTNPATPDVALTTDTGRSATDKITSTGDLTLGGVEAGATVEYSTDGGSTWGGTFTAAERNNTVQVRQTDVAGNVGAASVVFAFVLDTTNPAAPGVALTTDTGSSTSDQITRDGELTLSGVEPGATVAYSTDGGTTWTPSFTAAEGGNSVQVRQTDVAGNTGPASAVFTFTLDTTAPSVTGSMPATGGPTNAASITFVVTFGESVSNVDASDFLLTSTETARGAISHVTPAEGTTFTVTVTGLTGDGTVRVDLRGGTDVQDATGNIATAFSGGNVLTVDHTAPTAYISPVVPDPRNTAAGGVAIVFSEPMTEIAAENFVLTRNGTPVSLAEIPMTMVSDSQCVVDLTSVSAAPGAYLLTLVAGGSDIQDLAGNPLAAGASTSFVVHPWQNVRDVHDVNGDLEVTPNDVLLIINEINSRGAGPILSLAGHPPFVDVSGDDSIGPIDVLLVINFINRRLSRATNGEGEVAAAELVSHSSPSAVPMFGQAIPADQQSPWDVRCDSSGPLQSRRVQGSVSAFTTSGQGAVLSTTDSPSDLSAIAYRDGHLEPTATTDAVWLPMDTILGKPDYFTRVGELDDLLDLLANDVAATMSAAHTVPARSTLLAPQPR